MLLHLADEVEKLLGAPHGEGGNDDVAPAPQGLVEQGGQRGGVADRRLVNAVAVGALGNQVVGPFHRLGVADDGLIDVAQIAGEDQLAAGAVLGQPQLHGGGAEEMPRVVEAGGDILVKADLPPVFAGDDVLERRLGVGQGVEGLHGGLARTAALLVFPAGVRLLNVGRIAQHDAHQLAGQTGAVDVAPEALLDQEGNAPGVVDVGVGDNHVVDEAGDEIELGVVPFVSALLQAAVDENFAPAAGDAVAAAGDGLGRAVKCQFHSGTSLN